MQRLAGKFCFLAVIAGFVMMACGILLFMVQMASWMHAGTWPNIGFRALIGERPPDTGWPELQSFVDWSFKLPLSFTLLALGTLIGNIAAALSDRSCSETARSIHPAG